ncbi:recombination protein NinG [Gilliamella sp. Nev3-1]|uniref:recombination protein NinG n=1 Tax=Gilliamella sp. Nev3-1 TaxID=3120250 RepID=UPI00080E8638|nr:recombination protein NinG [Gilliamella apicola]OCG59004.1 NinG recombination protein [Gilliamella apicola]
MKSEIKQKKCKNCGKKFALFNSLAKVCSIDCAIQYAKDNRVQEQTRIKLTRITKEKIKTRSEHLRKAQTAFNAFIRERDKNEPCISCGRYHTGQYHAGHYRSVGACPELRFCELNVHKQCSACNNHKSGNIIEYRINLVKKIGVEKVEWLEGYHDPKKYTIEQIKQIKVEYKEKLKELKRGNDERN